MKFTKHFTWPRIKEDTKNYVKSYHECQMYKVKYKQPNYQMVLPEHSKIPLEVVHLDFEELKKRSEGVKKLGIDRRTRMVTSRAGKENADSLIF